MFGVNESSRIAPGSKHARLTESPDAVLLKRAQIGRTRPAAAIESWHNCHSLSAAVWRHRPGDMTEASVKSLFVDVVQWSAALDVPRRFRALLQGVDEVYCHTTSDVVEAYARRYWKSATPPALANNGTTPPPPVDPVVQRRDIDAVWRFFDIADVNIVHTPVPMDEQQWAAVPVTNRRGTVAELIRHLQYPPEAAQKRNATGMVSLVIQRLDGWQNEWRQKVCTIQNVAIRSHDRCRCAELGRTMNRLWDTCSAPCWLSRGSTDRLCFGHSQSPTMATLMTQGGASRRPSFPCADPSPRRNLNCPFSEPHSRNKSTCDPILMAPPAPFKNKTGFDRYPRYHHRSSRQSCADCGSRCAITALIVGSQTTVCVNSIGFPCGTRLENVPMDDPHVAGLQKPRS